MRYSPTCLRREARRRPRKRPPLHGLLALLSLLPMLSPAAVTAQTATSSTRACAPRGVVVDRLADGYGETRKSIGLGANNAVIEVFASDDSGTWTITATSPQGITCLIASGQAFERLNDALPVDDQDA